MRAIEILKENTTTLNKLYNRNFTDRDVLADIDEQNVTEANTISEDLTAEFIEHYKNDPLGMFMYAKSSYLDAVSKAKNFSAYAANLNRSHQGMSKSNFQDTVIKHFGAHLKNHDWPEYASLAWGEAEHDLIKELSKGVAEDTVDEITEKYYNLAQWRRDAKKHGFTITVSVMAGALNKNAKIYYAHGDERGGGAFYLHKPNFGDGYLTIVHKNLDEMALSTYKTMGDFGKPGPFTGADKKLVPHPTNIKKAIRFFEKTPYDFRLFFSHLKGTGKYSEHGPMSHDQLRQVFGQEAEEIINGSQDAITVVYVGNKGDAKVMLSPWVMAHRFGHSIQAGTRNQQWSAWREAEKYFFQTVNNLLEEYYGKTSKKFYIPPIRYDLTPEYNALFNSIGTQRSSRTGQIKRPYEFLYELFAQYLGTGRVTLNPLPTNLAYGRKAWGNPTKYMNIKPEYRDEFSRKKAADRLAHTMELLFNDVLNDSVGKIFVM